MIHPHCVPSLARRITRWTADKCKGQHGQHLTAIPGSEKVRKRMMHCVWRSLKHVDDGTQNGTELDWNM